MKYSSELYITDLEEIILLILANTDRSHGTEISEIVEQGSEGKAKISPGSLYPALGRLKTREMITSTWADETDPNEAARRKYNAITDLGRLALKTKQQIR